MKAIKYSKPVSYDQQFLHILADFKNWVYQESRFEIHSNDDPGFSLNDTQSGGLPELSVIHQKVKTCQKCPLGQSRNKAVFADGNPNSPIMLIGEAPGSEEDRLGLPFVGNAGKLLDKMLHSIDLNREKVYICNVLKCRPPGNRNPNDQEIENCSPYLEQQIQMVNPKIIMTLGNFATQFILKVETGISRLRGKTYQLDGRIILPTYHPSALLHNNQLKRPAWNDLKLLKSLILKLKLDNNTY
ncbi:MAG TPA: uracil-DNA glycosylase [Spirochaetes bacterium]|nr:uracil-DNA glycosylase [Spirochaetota bacterium]